MKYRLAVAYLLLASAAIAQEEVPLEPKAPKTTSEAKMLVNDAARTANELKDVEERIAGNEKLIITLAKKMDIHNAQYPGGTCTYTEQNPTACDPWIAESKVLNSQMDYVKNEHEQALIEKMELEAYMNMRVARLRITWLLNGLTEWEQQVIRCSKLPGVIAAQTCMSAAWEHHP